jgi:predicted  nucleic acid-binding Zn-ribbon protein
MDLETSLRQLVEADRWIERVRAQRDHLPERSDLQDVEGQLRALLSDLKEAQGALDPVRAAFEEAQRSAASLEQRAAQLSKQLATSTGGAKELEALQHELVSVQSRLSDAETLELEHMEALEPLEARLQQVKAQAQPLVARRAELQTSLAELEASLNEEISALSVSRVAAHAAVVEPWRSRYDAAMARVGVSGASFLDAGRCDGCRIALAPLDVDRFKHRTPGDPMECPECGRILLG